MKKYFFTILLLIIGTSLWASPLHSKLKHSIIIDTDCNDSDLREMSILLSHPGITIKDRSILIKLKSMYLKELKSVIDEGVKN